MTETILLAINGILVLALIAQSITHHIVTQKLLNKLMSRNYYEYATTKKLSKEKPINKKPVSVQLPPDGMNEMGVLDELHNQLVM